MEGFGFTGTDNGMSFFQEEAIRNELTAIGIKGADFHHGDCIGADKQAHDIAVSLGAIPHIHPCNLGDEYRAFCEPGPNGKVYAIHGPLERDRHIAEGRIRLFAAPWEDHMVLRSGTWSTVRYALKAGVPVTVIYRDGRVDRDYTPNTEELANRG